MNLLARSLLVITILIGNLSYLTAKPERTKTVEELQQQVEVLNQQLATTLMQAISAGDNVALQQACKFAATMLSAQLPRLSKQLALWASNHPEQKSAQRASFIKTAVILLELEKLVPVIRQNLLLQEAAIKAEMQIIKAHYPTTWLQWLLLRKGYEHCTPAERTQLQQLTFELRAIRSLALKLQLGNRLLRLVNWTAQSSSLPARCLYRFLR